MIVSDETGLIFDASSASFFCDQRNSARAARNCSPLNS
ncbi:hypothetical protein [Azospirillum argentinense]